MLKMSSRCRTPMIRNSRSTIFSKLGSKASLKKLRNLSLSLKERTMTAFKLAKGLGLTEAGIKVLEDIGRGSEQRQWDRELEGWWWGKRKFYKRTRSFLSLHISVPDTIQFTDKYWYTFTCSAGHRRWQSGWPAKGSASSLKRQLCVNSYTVNSTYPDVGYPGRQLSGSAWPFG